MSLSLARATVQYQACGNQHRCGNQHSIDIKMGDFQWNLEKLYYHTRFDKNMEKRKFGFLKGRSFFFLVCTCIFLSGDFNNTHENQALHGIIHNWTLSDASPFSLSGAQPVFRSPSMHVLQTSQNRNGKNFGETDRVLDVVSACPDAGRDDRQSRVVRRGAHALTAVATSGGNLSTVTKIWLVIRFE